MPEMVDGRHMLAQDYGTSVATVKTRMEKSTNMIKTVRLLIGAAQSDTIYRDVYLRRARDLLSPTLDQTRYRVVLSR
jgi:hypothetical protein